MKDKIQEKISQAAYGGVFGGMIAIGLMSVIKEKVVKKLKKTMTLVKSRNS